MSDEWLAEDFIEISDDRRKFTPLDRSLFLPPIKEHFGGLKNVRGKRFLDVGSGSGSPLQDLMAEIGAEIVSFDKSKAVVKRLKKDGKLAVQGNFLGLPFKPNSFDGVIQSEVINGVSPRHPPEHQRWLPQMLTQIHKVIVPDGVFIQTHIGDCIGGMIDAKHQLQLIAWAGFRDIHLIGERPRNITALSFIATKGDQHYLLKDALKSDFDKVYRGVSGYKANLGI